MNKFGVQYVSCLFLRLFTNNERKAEGKAGQKTFIKE